MNLEAERGRLLKRDAEWASLAFDRGDVERRRREVWPIGQIIAEP